LNRQPQDHPDEPNQARFGVNIRKLNDAERDAVGSLTKDGVKVVHVEPGSFADDIGVNEGDVIVSINRQPVMTVEDVKKIQNSLKPGSPVAFRVLRNQQPVRGRPAEWGSLFVSGTLPPR
jgi:serine protease Do